MLQLMMQRSIWKLAKIRGRGGREKYSFGPQRHVFSKLGDTGGPAAFSLPHDALCRHVWSVDHNYIKRPLRRSCVDFVATPIMLFIKPLRSNAHLQPIRPIGAFRVVDPISDRSYFKLETVQLSEQRFSSHGLHGKGDDVLCIGTLRRDRKR